MNENESEKPKSKFASLDHLPDLNIAWALSRRQETFQNRKAAIEFCEKQTPLWRSLLDTLAQIKAYNQIFLESVSKVMKHERSDARAA
jgi:hypothetical protein